MPSPTTWKPKPKPKGIVLAKKGSMVPAATVKAENKEDKPSAKKAVRPGLVKAQPKAKSDVEEKPAKVMFEKKPVVATKPLAGKKPVEKEEEGHLEQEEPDEKHDEPTDSAARGNAKRDKTKKESSVKKQSAAVIGTCFANDSEDGAWPSGAIVSPVDLVYADTSAHR